MPAWEIAVIVVVAVVIVVLLYKHFVRGGGSIT